MKHKDKKSKVTQKQASSSYEDPTALATPPVEPAVASSSDPTPSATPLVEPVAAPSSGTTHLQEHPTYDAMEIDSPVPSSQEAPSNESAANSSSPSTNNLEKLAPAYTTTPPQSPKSCNPRQPIVPSDRVTRSAAAKAAGKAPPSPGGVPHLY